MSEFHAPHPPEESPGAPGAASDVRVPPIDSIVDDLTPKEECADWIHDQIDAGRSPEEVTAELISTGWDEAEAESLVEYVRRATRRERGVATREDVVRRLDRSYRQSWKMSWFSGFLAIASGVRLIGAFRNWLSLRRSKRQL